MNLIKLPKPFLFKEFSSFLSEEGFVHSPCLITSNQPPLCGQLAYLENVHILALMIKKIMQFLSCMFKMDLCAALYWESPISLLRTSEFALHDSL